MSIRDIIEACASTLGKVDGSTEVRELPKEWRRFIATFDPEHVALMEAVCEAARDGIPCQHEYASSACLVAMREDSLCTTSTCNKALCAALAAIAAYRKEHGL
jgi:hypothetical protein